MANTVDDNVSIELTQNQDDSRFLVHHPVEILRILRGLAHRNEMVSAFFNGGKDLLLTSILDVDASSHSVLLDYGSNEALNQRILASEKIIFVTALDSVKIQFVTNRITTDRFEGRPAFRIGVPEQVLQLQRREYYRLTTPIVNPLKCVIPLGEGAFEEVALADISAGGIGIVIGNPAGFQFEPGQIYPGCRIILPAIGTLEATLRIQSIFEVTMKNGHKTLRGGCQFLDLRPAMQSLIQRYIIKLERERIANAPH